jgi:hypothetical protein
LQFLIGAFLLLSSLLPLRNADAAPLERGTGSPTRLPCAISIAANSR